MSAATPLRTSSHATTEFEFHPSPARSSSRPQTAGGTWVLLGRFPFAAGEAGFIELRDIADDSMRTLWYDAAKWVPVP